MAAGAEWTSARVTARALLTPTPETWSDTMNTTDEVATSSPDATDLEPDLHLLMDSNQEAADPGHVWLRCWSSDKTRRSSTKAVRLLVPIAEADRLLIAYQHEFDRYASDREKVSDSVDVAAARTPGPAPKPPHVSLAPCPVRPPGTLPIFNWPDVWPLRIQLDTKRAGGVDRRDGLKALVTELEERGPWRAFVGGGREVRTRLDRLAAKYPNAVELVKHLKRELVFRHATKQPIGFRPILLLGPPGVGKSVVATELASALGRPMYRLQGETSTHASEIVGTSQHWSTAGPGLLWEALVRGETVNPIVFIDEIEKAPKRPEHPGVQSVLYALLEPASASTFSDASLPTLKIDASHVGWIFAANSLEGIPAPLLSRMSVIEIPALTTEQALGVVNAIDAELRSSAKALRRLARVPDNIRKHLATVSPRVMHRELMICYADVMQRRPRAWNDSDVQHVDERIRQHLSRDSAKGGVQRIARDSLVEAALLGAITALQMKAVWNASHAVGPSIKGSSNLH